MQYVDDYNLTDTQQELKWHIYCELEWEEDSDIKAVLKSILADLVSK